MIKKNNNHRMKTAEFQGKVTATLEYLKENQNDFKSSHKELKDEIKKLNENVNEHLKKSSSFHNVTKWMHGILFTWLVGLTGLIIKMVLGY